MSTPYQDVWDKFNIATVAYELDKFSTPEQEEYLTQLMDNAIDKSSFTKEYFDLSDRDDINKQFADDLDTKVLQVIAEYMVYVWVGRMVYNSDILRQHMSSSAVKRYSPASQLKTLQEVHKESQHQAEKLHSEYAMFKGISKLG